MFTFRRNLRSIFKSRLLFADRFARTSAITPSSFSDLADCNRNVVSSPHPPIRDSLQRTPAPAFVSSHWQDAALAEKVAIRDGSTGETRTFSDYHSRMSSIASALKIEYRLKPDETVALFSLNNVDYLPICLAVGLCGSKVTPINPLFTANELSKILVSSESRILFAHAKLLPIALEAARSAPCVEHIVVIPDVRLEAVLPEGVEHLKSLSEYENVEDSHYHVSDPKNHPWLLPYSSGTTGLPKGCMLSHSNMVVNLLQFDGVEKRDFLQEHKLISPLPFFHIYGMMASLLYCGWRGQEIITMSDRFDIERFCQLVQENKPQRAHLVPPIILGLAKHPIIDNYDMRSLEMIISAAAPLGKDTVEAVQKRLNLEIKQAWGMSELSPLGTAAADLDRRVGSIGRLLPSTIGKVIDAETGESLGSNKPGELCIKGPQVMMGYFNDIEKTKECLSDDGWLRTGDLAYYDEDDFFYITDRIKELIKVRGFQVAPAELEGLILRNEHVQDVAVVQVPDEASGELPRAYVVLAPSAEATEVTEEYLKDWVKERVAPHKRIDGGVVFTEKIPKSASGKILRRILREEVKTEFERK